MISFFIHLVDIFLFPKIILFSGLASCSVVFHPPGDSVALSFITETHSSCPEGSLACGGFTDALHQVTSSSESDMRAQSCGFSLGDDSDPYLCHRTTSCQLLLVQNSPKIFWVLPETSWIFRWGFFFLFSVPAAGVFPEEVVGLIPAVGFKTSETQSIPQTSVSGWILGINKNMFSFRQLETLTQVQLNSLLKLEDV